MPLAPRTVLLLTAAAAVIWMLYEYLHRKRTKLAAFLLGTFSGVFALLLCHFYGGCIGFEPPLTLCTVSISAIAGIPAVILLSVLQYLHL